MENTIKKYTCEWCGKTFEIPEDGINSKRFCCLKCRKASASKKLSENMRKRVADGTFKSPFALDKNKPRAYNNWKCRFCEIIFRIRHDLEIHLKECHEDKRYIGWNKGQTKETNPSVKVMGEKLKQLYASGKITPSFKGKHHTPETRKKISEARKQWIKDNPDKYPWKRKDIDRFKSIPCEHLKEVLRQDFDFVEEFTDPTWEHRYSLDIAFLDKKLAIEVNGSQHYNSDGTLKEYYQNRHDYLVSQGWIVNEIYYAAVYKEDEISKIKEAIINGKTISFEEHERLFKSWIEKKNAKQKEKEEYQFKLEQAKKDGKYKHGKIMPFALSYDEWNHRKELILNTGIDFSKFGWITKVIKLTNLSKHQIQDVVNHFPEDFKGHKIINRHK